MNALNATQAHASALRIDRRYYVTCASNAVCELRYTRAHKRYYLHVHNSASYMLTYDQACAVYAVIMRHVVRLERAAVSVRDSVYVLRSDIRALMRAVSCAKFAH